MSASLAIFSVDVNDCFCEKAQELSKRIEQVENIMGTYYSKDNENIIVNGGRCNSVKFLKDE